STLERGLPSKPGRVCGLALAGIELDPLVDVARVGAVVGDGGLNQTQRDLQVVGRGALVGTKPFLDGALREGPRRDAPAARAGAEPFDSRVRQTKAEGLRHVAQG